VRTVGTLPGDDRRLASSEAGGIVGGVVLPGVVDGAGAISSTAPT
jgi:hypothetical protein